MRKIGSSVLIGLALALLIPALACSAPALAGDSVVNPGQLIVASGDGYFIAGSISYDDGGRLYFLKTDPDGNVAWCKKTTRGPSVNVQSVLPLDDGYLITGSTSASNNSSTYLLKIDLEGNQVWANILGKPGSYHNVFSMAATGDGYVIAGQDPVKFDFHDPIGYITLTKTDLGGKELWSRTYDGPGMSAGYTVFALSDGYLLAGDTYSDEDQSRIYLVRTDLEGNLLWNKTLTGWPIITGPSATTAGDGFLIAGSSWLPHGEQPENNTVYLLRIDQAGNRVWEKTYLTSESYDRGQSVVAVEDGYAVAGYSSIYHNPSLFLLKVDEAGNKIWNRTYSDVNLSQQNRILGNRALVMIADSGGYAVLGGANAYSKSWANTSVFVLRTDTAGNPLWYRTYDDVIMGEGNYTHPLTPLPVPVQSPGNSSGSIAISRAVPVAAAADGYIVGGRLRFSNGSHEEINGTVLDFADYPYLLKTDLTGNVDWVRVYDKVDNTGRNDDKIDSIAATSDGYLLVTSSDRSNDSSIRVTRTDLNGSVLWTRTYGDPDHSYSVYSVVPVSDGYLLDGLSLTVPGDLPAHGFLLKINQAGDLAWFRYMDDRGLAMVHSLTAVTDGYVIAGFAAPNWEVTMASLDKINLNGSTVWNTTINSSVASNAWYTSDAYSVAAVKDGYAAAGLSWEPHAAFGSQKSGAYLFKTDPNGSFAWDHKYLVSGGVDSAYSMAAVKDGYVVAGIADKYGQVYNQSHIFILKANPDGYPEWNVTFTGTADSYVSAVIALTDGYLVAGQNNLRGESGKVNQSLHLIRTDMSGNVVWDKTYADFTIPTTRTGQAQPAPTFILIVTPTPVPTATPAINVTPVQVPSPSPPATPMQTPSFGSALTIVALTTGSIVMLSRSFGRKGGDGP